MENTFSNPAKNIELFGLNEAAVVADLGSGTGAYSIEAAKKIGDDGKVYAIDVQKNLLENLKASADREGLSNVEIIWGDIDNEGGTKLAPGSCDNAIVCNVLFQLEDRETFINELKRILRKSGTVLVIDWEDSFSGMGPDRSLIFDEQKAVALFENNGFSVERKIEAGGHHYGLVFRLN